MWKDTRYKIYNFFIYIYIYTHTHTHTHIYIYINGNWKTSWLLFFQSVLSVAGIRTLPNKFTFRAWNCFAISTWIHINIHNVSNISYDETLCPKDRWWVYPKGSTVPKTVHYSLKQWRLRQHNKKAWNIDSWEITANNRTRRQKWRNCHQG